MFFLPRFNSTDRVLVKQDQQEIEQKTHSTFKKDQKGYYQTKIINLTAASIVKIRTSKLWKLAWPPFFRMTETSLYVSDEP